MGADVVIAIEAFGPRVAQVGLTGGGPRLLLAGHLGGRCAGAGLPVGDLDPADAELERRRLRTRRASASRPDHARPSARPACSGSPSTS
jgi:hypothetical protein